ncbi:MAG: PD-(D/E)XK nuclease family protein, partial [Lutibacter sp.]
MQSFIQKVVNQVLENKIPFSKQYIILPSQRAGVFLKNEFIAKLNKPNFLPTIISIEDFIQEIADVQLVDSIQLLFEFYKVYTQIVPKSELEPFAQVSQWANILINDFNEADSYLVNSQQLFANLKDIKRLENWFLNEKPTKLAKQYLHFFSYVDNIYEVFYNNLLQQKIGYSGLIYRETIKNLEFFIQHKKDFHFIFAGFNALNFAEEKLFQELLQANIASVYWDVDESFLKKNHLAGQFLRNYKNNWPYYKTHSFQWQEKNKSNDKSIEIIAAPKNVAQLKLAGQLLASQPNLEKTALVLADENLLNIALNSLPENVNTVNITMGYPLKYLPISNFFIEIFKLHLNKLKSENIQQNTYYYKDILKVISNSFLAKKYGKVLTKLKSNLLADNKIFIHINELISNFSESELKSIEPIISIFNPVNNLTDFIKMISNFELGPI